MSETTEEDMKRMLAVMEESVPQPMITADLSQFESAPKAYQYVIPGENIQSLPKIEIELVCRRCGDHIFRPVAFPSRNEAAEWLSTNKDRPIHECKDGSVGVADLIGFVDRAKTTVNEITPVQKPAESNEFFLPGGWVRVNTLLQQMSEEKVYKLLVTKICFQQSEKHRFEIVLINIDTGARYYDAEQVPAQRVNDIEWYVQLGPTYRKAFPQILE